MRRDTATKMQRPHQREPATAVLPPAAVTQRALSPSRPAVATSTVAASALVAELARVSPAERAAGDEACGEADRFLRPA